MKLDPSLIQGWFHVGTCLPNDVEPNPELKLYLDVWGGGWEGSRHFVHIMGTIMCFLHFESPLFCDQNPKSWETSLLLALVLMVC